MQNVGGRVRLAAVWSMVLVWGGLTYACTVAEENPATARARDSGVDTGTAANPTDTPDMPVGAAICGKYGGYDKVKEMAAAILARVSTDCRISGGLANLGGNMQHFSECFEIQLGNAFMCPGVSYVSNTTTDSKKQKCRDMTAAHKNLGLRAADFNAFVEDVNAELGARGLTKDDLIAIAPFFEGQRTGVVPQNLPQPTRNTYCACPDGLDPVSKTPCLPDAGPVVDSGVDGAVDSGVAPSDAGDSG